MMHGQPNIKIVFVAYLVYA